mmetsp:Transcript_1570/g.3957  ORF Transcript_1570/g.3957 Transcript_1570/m.3957 type:complete len:237 (+) Transcript_1570:341-1051(+)
MMKDILLPPLLMTGVVMAILTPSLLDPNMYLARELKDPGETAPCISVLTTLNFLYSLTSQSPYSFSTEYFGVSKSCGVLSSISFIVVCRLVRETISLSSPQTPLGEVDSCLISCAIALLLLRGSVSPSITVVIMRLSAPSLARYEGRGKGDLSERKKGRTSSISASIPSRSAWRSSAFSWRIAIILSTTTFLSASLDRMLISSRSTAAGCSLPVSTSAGVSEVPPVILRLNLPEFL